MIKTPPPVELRALIAQACEAAYRRGYEHAAVRSTRQPFTERELQTIHVWRCLLPKTLTVPPDGDGSLVVEAEAKLAQVCPELVKALEG